MERRYWLIVLALAALVAGSQWLLWLDRDRVNEQTLPDHRARTTR